MTLSPITVEIAILEPSKALFKQPTYGLQFESISSIKWDYFTSKEMGKKQSEPIKRIFLYDETKGFNF